MPTINVQHNFISVYLPICIISYYVFLSEVSLCFEVVAVGSWNGSDFGLDYSLVWSDHNYYI